MKPSLEGRLAALLLAGVTLGCVIALTISRSLDSALLVTLLTILACLLPALWLARRAAAPVRRLLRAMAAAVASYRDGDYSVSLTVDRTDELGELVSAHNQLADALREQRQHLMQRELLLDTVTQHSPVAIVLTDARGRVVLANLAARRLLNQGTSLQGLELDAIVSRAAPELHQAIAAGGDSLVAVNNPGTGNSGTEEILHIAQQPLRLRGRPHRLLLVKQLTRELSRQEVAIWKKLIRVLSHELNNSLAPITSLANTGLELDRRGDYSSLGGLLQTIRERSMHLADFIAGYAEFARLPTPRPQRCAWQPLLAELADQYPFRLAAAAPDAPGYFDRAQLEQALINLLKNAHESGSAAGAIELSVAHQAGAQRIEVRDRGPGMSEAVLTQALLPFYSTKRTGTGLGLALAREIAEAHGGQIRLANREGGGLGVTLLLPLPE
jgi:nitrogen fixation/metabolism regulation signal transduction histidine kinase